MKKFIAYFSFSIAAFFNLFVQTTHAVEFSSPTILPQSGKLAEKIKTGNIHFVDIPFFIGHFIKFCLEVAGAVAVLMIIVGGFKYVLAGLSPEKKESGKETIKNALMGLTIALLAWLIVDTIINLATTTA